MSSPSTKGNRILAHRNRQHVLRAVAQPTGPPNFTPQVKAPSPATRPIANVPKFVTSRTTKPFPFFELPGEIRNRIYDLVVPEARVLVSGNHPQKELEQMKKLEPLKKHKPPRHRLPGKFTGNPTDTSLLFTCRQMNQESIKYLYARTTFCFDRFVVLRKFLNVIPETARSSIQSMEITHVGYSEPVWARDRMWKVRHDARWTAVLEQIKQQTALRRLNLDITFFDWPIRLEISESWARCLLELAGDGLDWVKFTLEHDSFHPAKVAATAKELENRMMTAAGRKKKRQEEKLKEAEEKKRIVDSKRKATKVLTISLPLGTPKANGLVKKVVKSKGLEQYAVAQPPVAFC